MTAAWLTGNALSFDTETTGPDPETARIVTAHCVEVGPGGATVRGSWLVNPGCPIPAEATAIHGITDEMAAKGEMPVLAVPIIGGVLAEAWLSGIPVIVMCATYDLGVMHAEAARFGLRPVTVGPVLDPLVIDRACDPYRKGKRTLTALAAHYGVKQGAAHSAEGDALTAARIIWKQARTYGQIAHLTLAEMQKWQADQHYRWAVNFADYLRGKEPGKEPNISTAWPVRHFTKEAA